MKNIFITLIAISFFSLSFSQKKAAYVIYNSKGKKVSYQKMLKTIAKNDILLFGEYHNNPISHWLQLEVTKDLFAKRKITLGAEMFEADNQRPVSDYVAGKIEAAELDTTARLWQNHKTDYKPLLDFAKTNKLRFIAANVPRRFATMVFSDGFEILETLSDVDYEDDLKDHLELLD